MNRQELHKHNEVFRKYLSTFRETSRADPTDGEPEGVYCLPEGPEIEAVKFDDVQRKWFEGNRAKKCPCPCSVDAMYFADGKIYAVEFKSGTNVGEPNLLRKIYDTVLSLIEHDGITVKDCREKVVYVVVAPSVGSNTSQDVVSRASRYMKEPWKSHRWDRWGLYKLDGIVAFQTCVLPPDLFYRFAKSKHWVR